MSLLLSVTEEALVIRVFLAFDDASFGQQLSEYLSEQPDFQVCGQVEIGDEAVRKAIELRSDIAICDSGNGRCG